MGMVQVTIEVNLKFRSKVNKNLIYVRFIKTL